MDADQDVQPPGVLLTGKQEHYLKRELVSRQVRSEISELNSPTALRRFGAPFRSDLGEIPPVESELPVLRFIFVNYVRPFPFLDRAREKEFWQDRLQTFLESFARKHVSPSEDRAEESKRRKIAHKCHKLIELMMVSGVPTASGYEERIRFADMELVDRGANEQGLLVNAPEGHDINGWNVNVAGVRMVSERRTIRYHQHPLFLVRVSRGGGPDVYVGRRFRDFARLARRLRTEFPGKVLPPLPRKNTSETVLEPGTTDDTADNSSPSVSSVDLPDEPPDSSNNSLVPNKTTSSSSSNAVPDHTANSSGNSLGIHDGTATSNASIRTTSPAHAVHDRASSTSSNNLVVPDKGHLFKSSSSSKLSVRSYLSSNSRPSTPVRLQREQQRVSLRAYLRTLLQNKRIAGSASMNDFLTLDPLTVTDNDRIDMGQRREIDAKRLEEQRQFYEIARKRAAELDVYMEKFRRDIVHNNGLSSLLDEIRVKRSVEELSPAFQKLAEWMRIEVAATLYHLFLAEDNSPELFAQAKRIHGLIPYTLMKHAIRVANPAAVMNVVLNIFVAQPFGTHSLLQRIFSAAINDGISTFQKGIDLLASKIGDNDIVAKLATFTNADEDIKNTIREESQATQTDIVVTILQSDRLPLEELRDKQIERIFNSYVSWVSAVESDDANWFAYLKQVLKLQIRQRDKRMMLNLIEEPNTLRLFKDLFTIFYEPLVRVYKSANLYSSITDFAAFADDAIATIERAQRQDVAADPNQTVQAFIDVCTRHQQSFFKFVHEVHLHDDGLFGALLGWLDSILAFLRYGPRGGGRLDMNALFLGAVEARTVDRDKAIGEIDALIRWQGERKRWHHNKTRQKMANEGGPGGGSGGNGATLLASPTAVLKSSDFGLDEADLDDFAMSDAEADAADQSGTGSESGESSEDDGIDIDNPVEAERRRRMRKLERERLRGSAGEPVKPATEEIGKLGIEFMKLLRVVLAEDEMAREKEEGEEEGEKKGAGEGETQGGG